jgi:hypothetical protein
VEECAVFITQVNPQYGSARFLQNVGKCVTRPHYITSQRTIFILTAIRTSKVTNESSGIRYIVELVFSDISKDCVTFIFKTNQPEA